MRVRAKRLGWDQRGGAVSGADDYDLPAWADAGLPEDVEGELSVEDVPASAMYEARKLYRVGGQLVDPETIRRLDAPGG